MIILAKENLVVNNWDELPKDFGKKQFDDFNYKLQMENQ